MSMSLDEFLGHKSSSRDGGKILNWKKRKPPVLTTWLHTQAPFVALWRHGWPRLVEIERDGEKCREVWGGNFNCWEHEDVLKKQYRRTSEGARVLAPERCPLCLLAEYLRVEVQAGRLDWLAPVFEFEADDERASVVLTAAGIYNGLGGDRLSRGELAEMRQAGIRRDEAWKQNAMAKCAYVFTVVDGDDPEAGVQVCIETTALGDAVKRVVRDQMDALGEVEGHPLKTPYAIRWEYREEEVEFGRKYRALALPKTPLTPDIHALIVDSPPPDIGGLIARGDAASLRAAMEAAAKIALPFDRLFAAAGGEQAPARQARPAPTVNAPREDAPPARRRAAPPEPAKPRMPAYPPGTVLIPCDACKAQMADTDAVCWSCGATYELEEAPPPVKPAARGKSAASKIVDDIPW